jgi:hypothetical protein
MSISMIGPGLEFQAGAHTYRARKLSARQQLHVVRRIGPVVGQIMSYLPDLGAMRLDDLNDPATRAALEMVLVPIAQGLTPGRISDADWDYVLDTCLSVVQRQVTNGGAVAWAEMWRGGRIMFDDLNGMELIQVAIQVIQDNLTGFFSGPPQTQTDGPTLEPVRSSLASSG